MALDKVQAELARTTQALVEAQSETQEDPKDPEGE